MIYTMHKPDNILADVFIFFTAVGLSVVNENQRKKPTRIKQFHSDIKKTTTRIHSEYRKK